MHSLETIRAMNAETGRKARASRVKPLTLRDEDDLVALFDKRTKSIPGLGAATDDVEADELDVLFCDSSGFGSPSEPALTLDQFRAKLSSMIAEHGPVMVATGEAGQFQIYVHVWRADS